MNSAFEFYRDNICVKLLKIQRSLIFAIAFATKWPIRKSQLDVKKKRNIAVSERKRREYLNRHSYAESEFDTQFDEEYSREALLSFSQWSKRSNKTTSKHFRQWREEWQQIWTDATQWQTAAQKTLQQTVKLKLHSVKSSESALFTSHNQIRVQYHISK